MKYLLLTTTFAFVSLWLAGCTTPQSQAHFDAETRAESRAAYIPKNDVEFNNYNRRNLIADDPTTIMWCTAAFPIPSSPLFTVPIIGKVTSGSKRTFENDPGPDGMYGTSGQYDYGFTPAGILAEWHLITQFCTNEPLVWQREKTVIAMQTDPVLLAAHQAAREALKTGDMNKAKMLLEQAIKEIKK